MLRILFTGQLKSGEERSEYYLSNEGCISVWRTDILDSVEISILGQIFLGIKVWVSPVMMCYPSSVTVSRLVSKCWLGLTKASLVMQGSSQRGGHAGETGGR